jgi:hypothetical protein
MTSVPGVISTVGVISATGMAVPTGSWPSPWAAFPAPPVTAGRLAGDWYGPACRQLATSRDYAAIAAQLGRIRGEYTRADGPSREILRLLVAALLLHVGRLPCHGPHGDPRAGGEVYARFRAELERSARRLPHQPAAPQYQRRPVTGYGPGLTVFIVKCDVTFLIRGMVMTRWLRNVSYAGRSATATRTK